MTDELFPGVFVEEVSFRSRTIAGVSTTTWVVVVLAAFALVRLRRHRGVAH